ncbi:hypothetical protein OROGR_012154 [Orobanche gracilis]
MDPVLGISCSKSKSDTSYGASTCSLVPPTNSASKNSKVKAKLVENNEEERGKMVASLMKKNADSEGETIIGFDAEYALSYGRFLPSSGQKTRISHLIFTNGKRAYVVILGSDSMLPELLMWFILDPRYTFVSMGMKQHNDNLAQLYEAGCRNAVDLGELASEVKGDPRLRNCGIHLLAKGIGLSETPKPSSFVCKKGFSRPHRRGINEDNMTRAVTNTWAYQKIGKILLYG